MNHDIRITGTGLWKPEESISNEELVECFNQYVDEFNTEHAIAIEAGEKEALSPSSAAFIEKASGIKSRYVVEKSGVLDPKRMYPNLPIRGKDELSLQAEAAVLAGKEAMLNANKTAADIDGVIVAASAFQRPYPAISIEAQTELGIEGFAFDMNVACSSATFALQQAYAMIAAGTARSVLVLNPEICSPQMNYRDRDCHFIFGDVCTAIVVEAGATATAEEQWKIEGVKAFTQFSNNIRSDFSIYYRIFNDDIFAADKYFVQQGRKVFKEVCPKVASLITEHLGDMGWDSSDLTTMWLHQANINMNTLIAKRVLGHPASFIEAPVILDSYANTAGAGSIIAFHLHRKHCEIGNKGVICSFGAGYSIGSLMVSRVV